MKCHYCEQIFTVETDPKNCDYNYTDGAKKMVRIGLYLTLIAHSWRRDLIESY